MKTDQFSSYLGPENRYLSMPSTLILRCQQCGQESDIRYHYCPMCGTKLPPQQPSSPFAAISKGLDHRSASDEQVRSGSSELTRQVDEPCLLAARDDTNARLAYLLEDDLPESHRGRSVVLLLMLIGISVVGWHWREQLRTYVASQFARHPHNQTDQVGSMEAPGSQIGARIPNNAAASDNSMTAAGDPPVTTAQNPGAPGKGPDPVALPGAQNAVLIQNAAMESSAPDHTAPTSDAPSTVAAGTPQLATPAPIAAATPAATPDVSGLSGSSAQDGEQDVASAKQDAPASASATSKSRPKVKQTARSASDADELEAQGEKYLYGTGVPTSCSLARRLLATAAAQGNVKAKHVLGRMYATGHCVSRDLPQAYRWLAKSLRQDPNNDRLAQDLQVLWTQMTVEERQIAIRR